MHRPWAIAVLSLCCSTLALASDDHVPVFSAINVEFELLDRDLHPVSANTFRGQNLLLAFGFTHCAHICPLIAANMARAIKVTDKNATGVFVSVDTERDTPKITDDYAKQFSQKIHGLGGSYAQVAAAAKNFNVTFVVTKSEDNYTVQHTPSIFLVGPDGELIDVFAMNTPSADIAAAMQ